MNGMRLRNSIFLLLRNAFRALPLSEGQRDRLRAKLMKAYVRLAPPLPTGHIPVGDAATTLRAYRRADEPAIGHVAYRGSALPSPLSANLIAFYLPQFHTFPENDAWWGKGFTEWRNVTRALPQFEGHVQPRLPADLGFYDLRNPQVMRDQSQLAHEYGISAFCFYFYWFAGRTLMEQPLRQWLADDSIDLSFCLCWANESWARRWDGRDEDILMQQQHSAEDDIAFITHIAPYLRDRRALKVDGKPMMLIYRPGLLPDPNATARRWRDWCSENGIGEIHLAYVQSFERPDPREIGFDAAVEFPPNMSNPKQISADQWLINPDFRGDVRDWRELATQVAQRALPDYPLYPGVNPGWDNEARRSGNGRIYLHASPRGYRDWLRRTIHERLADVSSHNRFIFINAWNEWAEGAVLEPDARLGHAWLEATRTALCPQPPPSPIRPCAVIHAWYPEILGEILEALQATKLTWRLLVTTDPSHELEVQSICSKFGAEAEIHVFPNHGRDILPFLHVANDLLEQGEQLILKLHTKRSIHREDGGQWRKELTERLIAPERASAILRSFQSEPALGLVAPEGHVHPLSFYWGANKNKVLSLLAQFGLRAPEVDVDTFVSGSMFWVRTEALRPILDTHLAASMFESEQGQVDGTLAHAIERTFSLAVRDAGYRQTTAAELLGIPFDSCAPYAYAERG